MFAHTAYFCWVITRNFCGLIKFCWHSIFCSISWFLLRQQIFAYSASFVESSQGIFADAASFCWQSVFFAEPAHFCWLVNFLSTQHIFADSADFGWDSKFLFTQHVLLSYHHAFCGVRIFAYSAIFCLFIISHFDNSASFCWHSVFIAESAHFADLSNFCWYSIFCWDITMYLCWLIKFCWHSIFCWISWFFCWDSKFLLTQILITQQVFADTAYFLLNQLISLTCQTFLI